MRNASLRLSARFLITITIITLVLLSLGVTALMQNAPDSAARKRPSGPRPKTQSIPINLAPVPDAPAGCANVINDGGFEMGGIPSSTWDPETSTNFGTPVCDVPSCTTGGGASPPRTGSIWAWFGGIPTAETATLGQTVNIAASSTATLNFWMRIGTVSSPFTDVLNVRVDGTIVQSFPEPTTAEGAYTLRSINLDAFANGANHQILFEYIGPSTATGSYVIDDVTLDVCDLVTDTAPSVSSTTPANNALNQATNTNISITFDEPVNVAGNWFQISCSSSGVRNVADTAVTGGPTTFTINPNVDFVNAEVCTTTVSASQVTDLDATDPPDNMAADYIFTFITAPNGAFTSEVEPNNTSGTAQGLTGTKARVRGNIQPGTDIDFYSFTAAAGDRFYGAVATSLSSGGSGLTGDATLELFEADGTTIIESDNDDGSFAATAPSIAGTVLVTGGTYFVKVRHSSGAPASEICPYDLYLQLRTGAPGTESEPNNNGQTPNPIGSGWISGTIDPAGPPIDNDTFSIPLNAGDTIFISLDANPERDGTTFNPRIAIGLFDNFFLLADGSAAVSPNSEAMFFTVREAGTYVVYVDTAVAGAGPTATYQLSTSVFPAQTARVCTTFTSTNVPQTIPVAAGLATSTLNIPANLKIGNLRVNLNITHSALGELDISLVAPDGNEVVLVDDPPASAAGTTAPQIDLTLDDEAGIPMALFGINKSFIMQPESLARLEWFKNQSATGTWTLNIRDDAGVGSGTLNSWGLTVCQDPPVSSCSVAETTVFSSDFEAGDGGFTHSGTADEWERGLPAFAPITTCHSGTNCWKTDLDNTYNNAPTGQRVDQELLSPVIDLSGFTGQRVRFQWAMKYNVEGSNWENAFVEVRQTVAPNTIARVFEWAGPTMTRTVGSPAVTLNSAAGWGVWEVDISQFAGTTIQLAFHLDQDDSVALTGIAIDDVSVTACSAPTAAEAEVFGKIVDSNGAPVAGAVVRMAGTQNRKAITDTQGNYRFTEVETNGFYTLTPSRANYSFSPIEKSFSQLGNSTEAAFTATSIPDGVNAIDTPEFFVRQHYLDFLGREPDQSGFNFWSDQITSCGADAGCIERRTINVSAAYFLSIEFHADRRFG